MIILDYINYFLSIITFYVIQFISDFTLGTLFPVFTILFLFAFFIYYYKLSRPQNGTTEWITEEITETRLTLLIRRHPMRKRDIAPLAIVSGIFLILAIYNLGDTTTVDVMEAIASPSEERTHWTHMNNMYFDEIYFVRTAVEHIENINPFEISQPPLGKLIIASSIQTAGMTPFGWRLFGAILGVLMLVVMYIFIKNMTGRTIVATSGTLLLGFDFMRFVQTRIATIDTYVVLFILTAFFFMYRYITTNPDAPLRRSLLPLALSGIFFGLSFAVKWIGFYAGVGLLILYVIRLVQLGLHYGTVGKRGFGKYLSKTLLFSICFFVIIPLIIYYLTYIPYGFARGMQQGGNMLFNADFFQLVWGNQIAMFNYHSRLVAEHPFSSVWWQWILNVRPILYVNDISNNTRATFGAYGNPVVWWGGFVAMVIMVFRVVKHHDGKALFILIGYLSQLLPWVAVTRILFAYHYFPSTLFLVLALSHLFSIVMDLKRKSRKVIVFGYTTMAGLVFAVFYPSLSGMYMPNWYYVYLVRWFNTWPF